MTDNIRPDHYRTGEIDLYEAWYRTYPFNEYRAIMQAVAERYMRRDKENRVVDLGKAIYTLERLREKEIEHAKKNTKTLKEAFVDMGEAFSGVKTKIAGEYLGSVYLNHKELLRRLSYDSYLYLTRDKDGVLSVYDGSPVKVEEMGCWDFYVVFDSETIQNDNFPEVKWSDEEPTKISELLASYENGGESGKVEVE